MTPAAPRTTVMDKDRLAAFVDGELSPEESAAVVMHLADHPQDQAYVDDLTAANAALLQAFSDPLDEPVPTALRDLILGADPETKVVPFRPRVRRAALLWGAGTALAAGLAVAVFLPRVDPLNLVPGPLVAGGALHVALTTLPTGETRPLPGGDAVIILGSVPTPEGFCREVEVIRVAAGQVQAAIACTSDVGWTVEVVIAETYADAAEVEGFGTASGEAAQGFAPFLDRIGAGAFLSPEDEAAALAKGWTR